MTPERAEGLPQRLNYRDFLAPGVVLNADGAFLIGYKYSGPDQEYGEHLGLASIARQLHQDLAKLSSGWDIEVNAIRHPVTLPPGESHYPEPTSQLLGEERAAAYAEAGTHYETRHILTFTWLPPSTVGQKASHFLFGKRRIGKKHALSVLLTQFLTTVTETVAAFGHVLKLERLTDEEMTDFLRYCVTGSGRRVSVRNGEGLLHYAIGAAEFRPHRQIMDGQHVRCIGVTGFPEPGTAAQMLDPLLHLTFPLRLSLRFIFLSPRKAAKLLKEQRQKWGIGLWYKPTRVAWGKGRRGGKADDESVIAPDNDTASQILSVDREIAKVKAGKARSGYYTMVVVLRDTDEETVERQTAEVVQVINRTGFTAFPETDNFPYALKGSWPGHGDTNVRRPKLTSDHFANLMPTSSIWTGHATHPSPLYPANSPPLLTCTTTGGTPFFFSPPQHVLIIGPIGAGKTVLMNSAATAHLQYPGAQVNHFDYDAGGVVPTLACGGAYFDLDAQRYSPLAHIDQQHERQWALGFLSDLAELQHFDMTPLASQDLQAALDLLAPQPVSHKTITGLLGLLQTQEEGLREALSFYAGNGPGAVLDGKYTPGHDSHWLTFDLEQIQKRGPAVSTAVLQAQLHALEAKMDGRPTLILFEEVWQAALSVILRDYIQQSSATMRKKNVAVWLVMHAVTDLDLFPHKQRLLNNIGTYIFLPNEMAKTPAVRPHYEALGLSSRAIKKLAEEMRPKRDYLVKEGQDLRVMQLPWGEWHAALLGVNGRDHRRRVLELRQQEGELWLPHWLEERGQNELARQWRQRAGREEQQRAA